MTSFHIGLSPMSIAASTCIVRARLQGESSLLEEAYDMKSETSKGREMEINKRKIWLVLVQVGLCFCSEEVCTQRRYGFDLK